MRRIAAVVSAFLVLAALPAPALADPWDNDVCLVQFGPGGQVVSYVCVTEGGDRPRSHIIVCPPVVELPDKTYYCVMAPFPL